MAFDITKIHVGAARIFYGGTVAVTGTPPTYSAHTAGVPTSGAWVEVGLTENDCVFTYQLQKTEINAEQSLGPVDVYASDETVTLTFTCQEANVNALKLAFDSSVGYDSTTGDGFYFGGGLSVLAPMTTPIFFSAVNRAATTKYIVGSLYKAYSKDGVKFPFSKTKKGMYQVTLVGLADLSRNAKDQLGYLRHEN